MNEQNVNPTPEDGDLDDVEAHGVREVVAGLSAAAVLAGGAAAVVSQQHDSPGGANRTSITEAVHTELAAADQATTTTASSGAATASSGAATDTTSAGGAAGAMVTDSVDAAGQIAEDLADPASPNRDSTVNRVDRYVDDRVDDVRDLRDASLDTARSTIEGVDQLAADSIATARSAVRKAPSTVRGAAAASVGETPDVRETVRSAAQKIDAAIVLAGDAVRGIEGTASRAVAHIQPGASMGVDAEQASGWVTVTAGGQTLARVEVRNGQATVEWTTPSADLPVTIHYSGDRLLNEASLTV